MKYNAAEKEHIRLAEKRSEREEREYDAYINQIMSTVAGRKWMEGFLEACHVFATSFNGNALQTAFLEGERHVGLDLIRAIMRVCPDQYVQMMKERNVKETVEDGRRSASTSDRIALVGTDGRALVDPTND